MYIPQNESRFFGYADSPPIFLIPSFKKGYIVILQQYGAIAPANPDSSCLYIIWLDRSLV